MKLFTRSKKRDIHPSDVGKPMPVPTVEITAPGALNARALRQIKHRAVAVPEADVQLLRTSIVQGSSPPPTSSLASSLRGPSNTSTLSLVSPRSLEERRSSSRSLELLINAEETGQLPVWDNLPPSPGVFNPELIKKFSQWGDEAGSALERQQRARLVRVLVRAVQKEHLNLELENADKVTDLPKALVELKQLRTLTLSNFAQLSQSLDVRELLHLERIDINGCPSVRLQTRDTCEIYADGLRVRGGEGPPQIDPLAQPTPLGQRRNKLFRRF